MKYLLSTGLLTSDMTTYVKDIIHSEMAIYKRDIPYFDGGLNVDIDELDETSISIKLDNSIKDMLERISLLIPSIQLQLESIDITSSIISVVITINNTKSNYEIVRAN